MQGTGINPLKASQFHNVFKNIRGLLQYFGNFLPACRVCQSRTDGVCAALLKLRRKQMYQLGGTCQIGIQIKIHAPLCRLIKQLQDLHRRIAPVFLSDAFQMAYMQRNLKFLRY